MQLFFFTDERGMGTIEREHVGGREEVRYVSWSLRGYPTNVPFFCLQVAVIFTLSLRGRVRCQMHTKR